MLFRSVRSTCKGKMINHKAGNKKLERTSHSMETPTRISILSSKGPESLNVNLNLTWCTVALFLRISVITHLLSKTFVYSVSINKKQMLCLQ